MILVFQKPYVPGGITGQNNIATFSGLTEGSGGTALPPETFYFTVSGPSANALFIATTGVSEPWAPVTNRTA